MRVWNAGILAVTSALLLAASGGCVIAADAINPALLGLFNLDPTALNSSRGTVIVNFTNATQLPALFSAFETADPADLTIDTRNFSVQVDPGEDRNEVLECPIGAISLGVVTEEGDAVAIDAANAAIVFGADAAGTPVAYGGAGLISGDDFICGDVIWVTLNEVAGGFFITVQVIPGR